MASMQSRLFVLTSTALLSGCLAGEDPAIEAGDGGEEAVGTAESEEIFGPYDVGVIPATDYCPAGTENIKIRMDDEDSSNRNSRLGWIGATRSDRDTILVVCRVDGRLFLPLTTGTDASRYYAVLRLGSACPNGSINFSRYFDNEDDNNKNWFTTSISSPPTIWPNESSRDTRLQFCLFRAGSPTMTAFPSLAMSYGVFAAPGFAAGLASGWIHTDDEDSNNKNAYDAPSSAIVDAQQIVTGGRDTDLRMARVR